MDMVKLAKALAEFRTALTITDIPEDQIPIIVGAAGGVALALTQQ